jgi:type IV secretory pathway VirB10-like protein
MVTKKEQEEEARKARLLALVGEGAAHYKKTHDAPAEPPAPPTPVRQEAVVAPPAPVAPKPPAAPKKPRVEPPPTVEQAEEPSGPLGPEHEDPSEYLVKRRRSLRDDPNWIGTTLYLRRSTHAALVDACRGAGLDMSRVVQFCVALQMDEKQRSPVLSQLLGE